VRPTRPQSTEWSEPAPYRDDPGSGRSRRTGLKVVAALLVLGLLAAAAFMFMPTLQRKLPLALPTRAAGSLMVMSEPDGAQVFIDGQRAGVTPFAVDNRWVGRVKLELRLDGYEVFRDTFDGGKDAHIAATLKKKR
jgi:hypothetical protein